MVLAWLHIHLAPSYLCTQLYSFRIQQILYQKKKFFPLLPPSQHLCHYHVLNLHCCHPVHMLTTLLPNNICHYDDDGGDDDGGDDDDDDMMMMMMMVMVMVMMVMMTMMMMMVMW